MTYTQTFPFDQNLNDPFHLYANPISFAVFKAERAELKQRPQIQNCSLDIVRAKYGLVYFALATD